MTVFLALILAFVPAAQAAPAPDARFVTVSGGSLDARARDAATRARSAGHAQYWAAYAFDVRPGVSVDVESRGRRSLGSDDFNVSFGEPAAETRNLGIFLRYAQGAEAPNRIEIYNLDRKRDYDGLPVYWLGRAPSAESFDLLERLIVPGVSDALAERAVAAIGVHDDARRADVLEAIVRSSQVAKARSAAVIWIGISTDRVAFLADLVRNERESVELREQAATAIGIGESPQAIATLRGLFAEVKGTEVRRHVLVAAAIHDKENRGEEAVDFLVDVAENERDAEIRRQAIFWLSQKAGKRSLDAITRTLDDGDESIQEHAVFAISQRPKEEALPILMNLAKTHRSQAVRQKAVFWLGQIDDPRVVDFLKELLRR